MEEEEMGLFEEEEEVFTDILDPTILTEEGSSFSSHSFRERFFPLQKNIAQYFPNNVLFSIFCHFSHPEIISLSHVCKHWYVCSRNNITWKSFRFDGFIVRTLPEAIKLLHSIFGMKISPYQNTTFIPIQNLKVPIRNLSFGGKKECGILTPDNFFRLTSIAPFLESLKLPSVTRTTNSIDDNMLKIITSNLPELRKLDISTHTLVTNRGFQMISKCSPKLTHLKFDFCSQITSEGLMMLLRTCQQIKSISCLYCVNCNLELSNVVSLSQLCNRLDHLEIDIKPEVDNLEKFFSISNNFSSLHLRGWYMKYAFQFSNSIRNLRRLRNLKVEFHPKTIFDGCRIQNPSLRSIKLKRAQILKRIEIYQCPSLEEFVLEKNGMLDKLRFDGCSRLRILKLRGSRITISNFDRYIDNFHQLEEFEMFDCSGVECFKTESKSLKRMRVIMCRNLRILSATKCPFLTDLRVDLCLNLFSMNIIAPNLRCAKLFQTPHQQLPIFSEFQLYSDRIESLNFPRCVHLSKLQVKSLSLRALNLSDCKSLSLQQLNVLAPNLFQFGLSLPCRSRDFSPEYVTKVFSVRHPNLRMLSLNNFEGMTDQTLETICRCFQHSLQAISLTNVPGISMPRIGGREIVGVEFNNCTQLSQPLFKCPKLRKLFFRKCNALTDLTLCCLSTQNVPNLLNLECRNCSRLRNPRVVLPMLRTLMFEGCPNLNQPYIQCPSLKECLFQDCYSLSVPHYSTQEKQMSKLVFSDCHHANDLILKTVNGSAQSLQNVFIHQCSNVVRPQIGRLPSLNFLTFSACRNLVTPSIRDCPSLAELRFNFCPSLVCQKTEDFLIGGFSDLKLLEIIGSPRLNSFVVGKCLNNINPVWVKNLVVGQCNLLKILDVTSPTGSEVRIRDCLNLRNMKLSMGKGNENVPKGRLVLLRNKNLESVSLRGVTDTILHSCVAFGDDGICRMLSGDIEFGNGGSLTSLNIVECHRLVSPTFSHPRIRKLRIYDCNNLHKMRCNIPSLKSLELRGRGFNQNFVNNLPIFLSENTRNSVQEVFLNGNQVK